MDLIFHKIRTMILTAIEKTIEKSMTADLNSNASA
jgi:hypothetical protein